MVSGQTSFVVLAFLGVVGLDVAEVVAGQAVDGLFNVDYPVFIAHGLGREKRVGCHDHDNKLHKSND